MIAAGGWRVALALAQTVLTGFTAGASLALLVPLLALTGMDTGVEPLGVSQWVARLLAVIGLPATLPTVLGVFLGITALQAWLAAWQGRVASDLQCALATALRRQLYDAIVRCRWAFFVGQRQTDLSHALTVQVEAAGGGVYQVVALASGVVIALVNLAVALFLAPFATVAALSAAILLAMMLRRGTRHARGLGEAHLSAFRGLHGAAIEHLGNLKIMKSAGAELRSSARLAQLSATFASVHRRMIENETWQRSTFEVGSALVMAIMVLLSVGAAHLSVGGLVLLLFTFARLTSRLFGLQQNIAQLMYALPGFAEVDRLIGMFRAEAETVVPTETRTWTQGFRTIAMRNVSFAYDDGTPVLLEVSFELQAGSITAFAGGSGAGKTTLLDLLMGLLKPASGEVLVDDTPLEVMPEWRRRIGYVPQDVFLFNDTVRANLAWANPGASEAELRRALELAAAWEFVAALEHGMDTTVGDRGCLLSGGERQRLALARALLMRPSLLILDEATNALDRVTEDRVLDALETLRPEVTIVMVAHRASCLRRANVVHVLDGGRIVESGSPEVLLSQSSRLRTLQSLRPEADHVST